MARLHHVKKARKDNAVCKKGESYYWWQFAFSSKSLSKTMPRRSQLTQSSFLSQLYDLEDDFSFDRGELEGSRDDLVSTLVDMRDECQDSLDNMPEHLQDTSDSGCTLTERIENLDEWISNLEGVDCDIDFSSEIEGYDEMDEDEQQEARDEKIEETVNELDDCKTL